MCIIYVKRSPCNALPDAGSPTPLYSPTESGSSTEADGELQALRSRYLDLHTEVGGLLENVESTEVLLKDMRDTVFGLRVAAQAFDAQGGDFSVVS
jgi:hypothetical protein